MNTSIKLIKLFSDSNILRQYAVFLQLKHIHVNSCIYKYNVHRLAQKSGMSRNSINKYVKFFLDNGWCRMHGKNIVFISLKELRQKYSVKLKHTINISRGKTQKVLSNLRYELLKQKTNQFNFLKDISNDLHNPKGKFALEKHKRALKYQRKTGKSLLIDEVELKISLKRLGKVINLSPASAFNLIKSKQIEGKATVIKELFIKSPREFFGTACKYITQGYFKGNFYYIPTCNKYVFS